MMWKAESESVARPGGIALNLSFHPLPAAERPDTDRHLGVQFSS